MMFFRWWVLFILTCAGCVVLWYTGFWEAAHEADKSRLSYLIYAACAFYFVRLGWCAAKDKTESIKEESKVIEIEENAAWVAKRLPVVGMIGTVIGFIIMLQGAFVTLDVGNPESMQAALVVMATGMGCALYTTLAGLVCGLLLNLTLRITE